MRLQGRSRPDLEGGAGSSEVFFGYDSDEGKVQHTYVHIYRRTCRPAEAYNDRFHTFQSLYLGEWIVSSDEACALSGDCRESAAHITSTEKAAPRAAEFTDFFVRGREGA